MAIIYLVGARGSGKTTAGRVLARRLGCDFVDLDEFLCEKAGKTVAEIVAAGGWEQFRALESGCLREVTDLHRKDAYAVLATGGGIILSENNRAYLGDNGLVFWLRATAEVLEARLESAPNNSQRPSLTGKTMLEEIREVLEQRDALYRACAHHVISANLSPEAVCMAMTAHLIDACDSPCEAMPD